MNICTCCRMILALHMLMLFCIDLVPIMVRFTTIWYLSYLSFWLIKTSNWKKVWSIYNKNFRKKLAFKNNLSFSIRRLKTMHDPESPKVTTQYLRPLSHHGRFTSQSYLYINYVLSSFYLNTNLVNIGWRNKSRNIFQYVNEAFVNHPHLQFLC